MCYMVLTRVGQQEPHMTCTLGQHVGWYPEQRVQKLRLLSELVKHIPLRESHQREKLKPDFKSFIHELKLAQKEVVYNCQQKEINLRFVERTKCERQDRQRKEFPPIPKSRLNTDNSVISDALDLSERPPVELEELEWKVYGEIEVPAQTLCHRVVLTYILQWSMDDIVNKVFPDPLTRLDTHEIQFSTIIVGEAESVMCSCDCASCVSMKQAFGSSPTEQLLAAVRQKKPESRLRSYDSQSSDGFSLKEDPQTRSSEDTDDEEGDDDEEDESEEAFGDVARWTSRKTKLVRRDLAYCCMKKGSMVTVRLEYRCL
eukprot:GFYU01025780.1.p1 GENE.GFYU01025780.1~~GFYU01025780.1.p1  ORF type:complete len:346 (-),score=61.96 GFYU01025780.1:70-1014(-)